LPIGIEFIFFEEGIMASIHNISYTGVVDQEDQGWGPAGQNQEIIPEKSL
jgi:hypothetical protein